jgi:hypothetical protein
MNGLINRAIECFVRDGYGDPFWQEVTAALGLGEAAFEPLMPCEREVTARLVAGLAARLGRGEADLLEDLGTYLVSQPRTEPIRRLLRFGGVDFAEFLESLEDLPDRARLAIADLDLPAIGLHVQGAGAFRVEIGRAAGAGLPVGPVLLGLLRAMADDYGALVVLEYDGGDAAREIIEVRLLDAEFADGRAFALAAGRAAP